MRGWFDSLKNKAVSIVILVVVLTVAIATVIGTGVGQRELELQARDQVMTVAEIVSNGIDDKLEKRFDTLNVVARSLSMSAESLTSRAQLMLNRQVALGELFDSLYLMDDKGLVIAALPEGTGAVGMNVKDRPYFRKTSAQLTTLISRPFLSRDEHKPVVVITAPVLDFKGRMTAVLTGSIKLSADNFLGRLSRQKVGKSGHVVVAAGDGTILADPDPANISKLVSDQIRESGNSVSTKGQPVMSAGGELSEGTRLTQTPHGRQLLTSVKQLNQAPWTVVASLPLAEAFAPITYLRAALFWVALGLIVVMGFLALAVFSRLLAPLGTLAAQLKTRQREHSALPVQVHGGREIRQLAKTFNLLTDERQKALDDLAEREVFFRSLSESMPIGIVRTDIMGRIIFTNPAFQNIMGLPAEAIAGRHLIDGVHEEDQPKVLAAFKDVLRGAGVYKGQYRLVDRQRGRTVWVRTKTQLISTSSCILGSVNVIRDITQELAMERELEIARKRAESILGVLQEAVILTDRDGVIEFANEPAHVFMNAPGQIVGKKLFDQISLKTMTAQITLSEIQQLSHVDSLDVVLLSADGTEMDVELTMLRLEPEMAAEQFVFVLRDDSEKRRQEQQLSWEATHDSLTGLANRRAFNDRLNDIVTVGLPAQPSSALMMIDLDYFKPVNDTGGHLVGDELLRSLANTLMAGVRQADLVARMGGDEFAVILPGCSMERALVIAESLRAGIAGVEVEDNGQRYRVTASIGVAEVTADDTNPKVIIARADEAAYIAKAEGRNRVVRERKAS